jgi:hypothetical protein
LTPEVPGSQPEALISLPVIPEVLLVVLRTLRKVFFMLPEVLLMIARVLLLWVQGLLVRGDGGWVW